MLALLRHRFTPRILSTFLFEMATLNLAFAGLVYVRLYHPTPVAEAMRSTLQVVLFASSCTLATQFCLWSFGLYSRSVIYCGRRVFLNLGGAFVALSVGFFPLCYAFSLTGNPLFAVTLKFYVLLLAVFFGVVALERYAVLKLLQGTSHFGNVLVLGTGSSTEMVVAEARRHLGDNLRLVGVLAHSQEQVGRRLVGVPVVGLLSETRRWARALQARTLLLATNCDDKDLPLDFLLQCRLNGIKVIDSARFYESVAQKLLIERLTPYELLSPEGYAASRLKWGMKSIHETCLAVFMLTLLALPLLLVALLIRMTSSGPVIYRQRRVGKDGRVFTLYKFRTMREDAEKGTGAVWASKSDPRVTAVGKWLRRLRIDELPQLINILKGDMAFVGPRPERPEFVAELEERVPFYSHRHFVKPGLTGWAQVAFAYAATVEDSREKLRYDLYYVKHMGLMFDILILLATAKAVVQGRGLA